MLFCASSTLTDESLHPHIHSAVALWPQDFTAGCNQVPHVGLIAQHDPQQLKHFTACGNKDCQTSLYRRGAFH